MKVRQPGLRWLAERGWSADQAPPVAGDLPAYWRELLFELWQRYSRTCAYLSIRFEWKSGAQSTDHFIAKAAHAGQAYEWSNYRLSCLGANRRKNRFDDVLDPFLIAHHTFVLSASSGGIAPNAKLVNDVKALAVRTIDRLGLDDAQARRMRAEHVQAYLDGEVTAAYLRKQSPFVWTELDRQGLLR